MVEFEYLAPRSLEEALSALVRGRGTAIVLAGGTGLIPMLRAGTVQPSQVIDLRNLDDLKEIRDRGEYIEVGALVPLEAIEQSALLQQRAGVLTEATRRFANPLIRKCATLGGNLVGMRSPADMAVPLLALDVRLRVCAPSGKQRDVKLADFLSREAFLDPSELITHIQIPVVASNGGFLHSRLSRSKAAHDYRWFYAKLSQRKAGASAIVSLALIIERKHEKIHQARIALGSVAPKPMRAYHAEASLVDTKLDEIAAARCVEALIAEITPRDDLIASASYRASMVQALMRRALQHVSAVS